MEWHKLYPKNSEPTMAEIVTIRRSEDYGGADLLHETAYNTKPKITYSGCFGMPAERKYQKADRPLAPCIRRKTSLT
jgi:hypothetical protein